MVNLQQPHPVIRTPDQRIRVFVSSTLRELADERRAVRAAIERMRLAPVMFELGARPHPPRELYRSYLSQSDVFVGIYGSSYGWVAPDEEISGLEDEYNLAPKTMPKLTVDDPAAKALLYVEDTTKVDKKNPLAARHTPAQKCDNCAQIQGKAGDEYRPCGIFPGKLVHANGWCSVWAKKA